MITRWLTLAALLAAVVLGSGCHVYAGHRGHHSYYRSHYRHVHGPGCGHYVHAGLWYYDAGCHDPCD